MYVTHQRQIINVEQDMETSDQDEEGGVFNEFETMDTDNDPDNDMTDHSSDTNDEPADMADPSTDASKPTPSAYILRVDKLQEDVDNLPLCIKIKLAYYLGQSQHLLVKEDALTLSCQSSKERSLEFLSNGCSMTYIEQRNPVLVNLSGIRSGVLKAFSFATIRYLSVRFSCRVRNGINNTCCSVVLSFPFTLSPL